MKFPHSKPILKDWISIHPYDKPSVVDDYYFKIVRKVFDKLNAKKYNEVLTRFSGSEAAQLCCGLVAYFEDIISDFGLWQCFVKEHKRLYAANLPFYKTEEDYYEDEINVEDIKFLIWHHLMMFDRRERSISPESTFINLFALEVYEVFDEEFENAPANELLREEYMLGNDVTDYYIVRSKMQSLLYDGYLFRFSKEELEETIEEVVETYGKENMREHGEQIVNETIDNFSSNYVIPLMAYRINEWYAKYLGEQHPLYDSLLNLEHKKQGYFLYLREDKASVYLQHLATETIVPISKKSMTTSPEFVEGKTMVFIGFVKWMNEWWFSGVMQSFDYDEETLLTEKKSMKSRILFGGEKQEKIAILHEHHSQFIQFNGGKPIAYFAGQKHAEKYMNDFVEFQRTCLNLSPKEQDEAIERFRKKGLTDGELNIALSLDKQQDPCLVYFNANSGTEIAIGFNELIPDPNNPFYNPKHDPDEELTLVFSEYVSGPLMRYLKENFKFENLKFPNEPKDSQLFLKNIDFISRYFKLEEYEPKPEITLV